jgi:hypothetical protein
MIEKIATGKVEAFLKDVTLIPQAWVRDAARHIAQLVKPTTPRRRVASSRWTVSPVAARRRVTAMSDHTPATTPGPASPRGFPASSSSSPAKPSPESVGSGSISSIGFFADQIVEVARMGVQLGLVIGGGNIVRGSQLSQMGMDRGRRRLHGHARHRHQCAWRCRTCSKRRGSTPAS